MSAFKGTFSENEDDPEVVESSGSEWDIETERQKNKRRTSQRLSKKPRVSHVESGDSDSDDSIEEVKRKNSRNGVKKQKLSIPKESAIKPQEIQPQQKRVPLELNKLISNVSYTPGTFVIAKKDAQSGDMSNPPCIWKIDGKALLQKYEAFEQAGKIRHRNTSVYTGWSALDKDTYSPIKVKVCHHTGPKMEVEINWEDLKTIDIDSD